MTTAADRHTVAHHSAVDHAVRACAAGSPVILLDGQTGGVLVAAADDVAASTMALLIRLGTGIVQVALPAPVCDRLVLPPMVWPIPPGPRGAQCVAVDAAEGITTGISAADRARTARLLASPTTRARDLVRPGHVIPLRVEDTTTHPGPAGSALHLVGLAGGRAAVVTGVVSLRDPRHDADIDDLVQLADTHRLPMVHAADLA